MKNLLWVATLMSGLFLASCAPKNDSGTVGATATANSICPAGSWYTNGQCINGNSTTTANANFNNGFYADNYSRTASISVTNPAKMKELYKLGMGVCDLAGGSNLLQASCEYYLTGYTDIIIQFPNNGSAATNALVTIIAQPRVNQNGINGSIQLPSGAGLLGAALGYLTGIYVPDPKAYTGAYRNPLQIPMNVSMTNNNMGFQAMGLGDYWTGLNQTVVTIQVLNGNPSSSSTTTLNYNLLIGGVQAATGVMRRCPTYNCGL